MFQLNSESFIPTENSNEFLSQDTKSDFRDYLKIQDSQTHLQQIRDNPQIQHQKKILTRRIGTSNNPSARGSS